MELLPPVSILISTKGRRELAERLLISIKELDYPEDKLEIVVVEETAEPKPFEGVKYITIPTENRGFAYSRNVALKHASHPVVAFTDDDCLVHPQWLRELVSAFRPGVVGVAGAVLLTEPTLIGYCESILGFPGGGIKYLVNSDGKLQPTKYLSTCNCAYLKEKIEEVGGFKDQLPTRGTDYLLAKDVSKRYTCLYNPRAIVYHQARGSFRGIFRWFVRRGRGELTGLRLVKDRKGEIIHLLSSSITLKVLLVILLLSLLPIGLFPALIIAAIAYYSLMLYRYYFGYRYYKSLRAWLLVPLVKLMMDLGTDYGRLSFLLGRKWKQSDPFRRVV